MARKEITIPADGEFITVKLTGRSVIVEEMNKYSEAAQVPTMDLINGISDYPLYNLSTYPNNEQFNSIKIRGTSESAGDTIRLLSTNACLELDIKVSFAGQYEERVGLTFEKLASDVAQTFTTGELINASGQKPKKVIISVLENPLKYAFQTTPNQNDFGHVLIDSDTATGRQGELLEIEGYENILDFNFLNANNAANSMLTVTCIY